MRDLVAVRILTPVDSPTGGHWNRGEIAGFEPEVAQDLIRRGVAEALPKALEAPPRDRMVRRGVTKGP